MAVVAACRPRGAGLIVAACRRLDQRQVEVAAQGQPVAGAELQKAAEILRREALGAGGHGGYRWLRRSWQLPPRGSGVRREGPWAPRQGVLLIPDGPTPQVASRKPAERRRAGRAPPHRTRGAELRPSCLITGQEQHRKRNVTCWLKRSWQLPPPGSGVRLRMPVEARLRAHTASAKPAPPPLQTGTGAPLTPSIQSAYSRNVRT